MELARLSQERWMNRNMKYEDKRKIVAING